MQWILQNFEDTQALAEHLARAGLRYSVHKIVPFVGDLLPEPEISDPMDVILFGAYTLRHYSEAHGLRPGVITLRPFLHETPWLRHMLNGPGAQVMCLRDVPARLPDEDRLWFLRPVDDSKAAPGRVHSAAEIHTLARKVLSVPPAEIPRGSLRPETELMLTPPARIQAEWRVWVVAEQVVTASLYKLGARVTYQAGIDADALAFAEMLVRANPGYAPAYVLDICRTGTGLRLLETNCLNAAGFYAADLPKLIAALEAMPRQG